MQFLIDSATISDVERILKILPNTQNVLGITTNPNAMYKAGVTTRNGFIGQLKELRSLLNAYCDRSTDIHIQLPVNFEANPDAFIQDVVLANKESFGNVVIKVNPFAELLNSLLNCISIFENGIPFNATGGTQFSTAQLAGDYFFIRYYSVLTGRLEEAGVPSGYVEGIIRYANARIPNIIAGSMRTIEQVNFAIKCGCIPTIGPKIWDISHDTLNNILYPDNEQICKAVNEAFFRQMNTAANTITW